MWALSVVAAPFEVRRNSDMTFNLSKQSLFLKRCGSGRIGKTPVVRRSQDLLWGWGC